MKRYVINIIVVFVLMAIIPCISILNVAKLKEIPTNIGIIEEKIEEKNETSEQPEEQTPPIEFKVLNHKTNEVFTVSAADYVKGVVAGEMPANFHNEALKAQAVAAYTYAVRLKEIEQSSPTESLMGADFTTDPSKHQAYMSMDEIKAFYGNGFEENFSKISNAVDEVIGQTIVYDNQPIAAAFHAMSSGKTESSKNVWGSDLPYLRAVESSGDLDAPKYEVKVELEKEKVRSLLSSAYPDIEFSDDVSKWIKITETSDSSTVLKAKIGNKELSGFDIRNIFSLRSPSFTVEVKDDLFTFTCHGSGHGVGMSQYGANALAESGYTYEQILKHYYQGVDIV